MSSEKFPAPHHLITQTVNRLTNIEAEPRIIIDTLFQTAKESGRPLVTKREMLQAALCPLHFIEVRTVLGGLAPKTVAKFLRSQEKIAARDEQWHIAKAAIITGFPQRIVIEKWAILRG